MSSNAFFLKHRLHATNRNRYNSVKRILVASGVTTNNAAFKVIRGVLGSNLSNANKAKVISIMMNFKRPGSHKKYAAMSVSYTHLRAHETG
jgi:hypothetical protein